MSDFQSIDLSNVPPATDEDIDRWLMSWEANGDRAVLSVLRRLRDSARDNATASATLIEVNKWIAEAKPLLKRGGEAEQERDQLRSQLAAQSALITKAIEDVEKAQKYHAKGWNTNGSVVSVKLASTLTHLRSACDPSKAKVIGGQDE